MERLYENEVMHWYCPAPLSQVLTSDYKAVFHNVYQRFCIVHGQAE